MHDLASYLIARVPDGMSYADATQFCLRLYCTVAGVPEQLLPLSREVLGDAFAKLASVGWVRDDKLYHSFYGANLRKVTDRGHWVEVMAAIFKKGPDVVDMARWEALGRHVGFFNEAEGHPR
jgi:hypothetical protein